MWWDPKSERCRIWDQIFQKPILWIFRGRFRDPLIKWFFETTSDRIKKWKSLEKRWRQNVEGNRWLFDMYHSLFINSSSFIHTSICVWEDEVNISICLKDPWVFTRDGNLLKNIFWASAVRVQPAPIYWRYISVDTEKPRHFAAPIYWRYIGKFLFRCSVN